MQANRAEVIGMLETEFDERAYIEVVRKDGVREGREEGIEEGKAEGSKQTYVETLQEVGTSYEDTILKFMDKFAVSRECAEECVHGYWK